MELHQYVQIQHMARKKSEPYLPSFARSLDAKVRIQEYAAKFLRAQTFSHLARRRGAASEFVASIGFSTPEVFVEDVALRYVPRLVADYDQCVIKPVHATNSWGVLALVRMDERHWRDINSGEVLDFGQLLEQLSVPMRRYGFPDKWQVEELLLPVGGSIAPLDDFKFYAFHGEIGLVLQTAGRGENRRYKWYQHEWREVAVGKYQDRTDSSLDIPTDPEGLMAAARSVSVQIPVPFCRIDMYESSKGFYVGELTPEPGGYHEFSDEFDVLLGTLYEQAHARLAARVPDGSVVPL